MKFSIQRDPLLEALQEVQSVVEKKSTVQILSNILCSIKNKVLSLSATDLEVGVKINLPLESGEDGKITLSAKHFLDIVKELPAQSVLQVSRKSNDWVEIVCGKSKFSIVSLSADEYPPLPSFEDKKYLDARTATLADMIDKTAFAVSTDATRYHMNGVYFEHLDNAVMRMVATDGHRLSFVDQEVFKQTPEIKKGIIIPKKGLLELRKLLGQDGDTIKIAFEKGYLFANLKDTYLFIRLIEGEYPDYKPVIPKEVTRFAQINRDAFISALRRVSLLAHEKSRGVKLNLKDGLMTISSSNPDMGEAREEVEINYSAEPVEISFNAKYLLDCLPMVNTDEVEFSFKERLSPGTLQGVGQKNHTYVIMPMRI
jgi:DNA polymerase-3 subunit beta